MRALTFAVAGHVDHGKTALTRALTGVDTDALAEEKRRGLTIEPGFAPLRLEGALISLVDGPGHEKFIHNLLSASGGVDALLLAVDGREGPMSQTWEHLELLTLLAVERGAVALTKADLLSPAEREARRDALALALRGTILEGAPILPVSARTGEGLGELKAALAALAAACPPREEGRPFRLPVDRAFSVDGFGAVITGTIWDGRVQTGDTLQLFPGDTLVRVRGLQRHGEAEDALSAGSRAALNLAGVEAGALSRGMTAAAPGSLLLTDQLDAFVTVWEKSPLPLSSGTPLRFYHGSGWVTGRAFPLGGQALAPGGAGFVQLRLDAPAALRPLDRFVLRALSPAATLGGGRVLDPLAPRHRRREAVLPGLEAIRAQGRPALARLLLRRAGVPLSTGTLARQLGLSEGEAAELLAGLDDALPLGGEWISREALSLFRQKAKEGLGEYHAAHPLSPGMGREELRALLPDAAAEALAWEGAIRLEGPTASLPGFVPAWPPQLLSVRDALLARYEAFGLAPPENTRVEALFGRDAALARQAGRRLEEEGLLIPYAHRRRMGKSVYDRALSILRRLFSQRERVTLAQFRDAAGVNRDAALLLLEYWDGLGLTRRVGDGRVLLER